MSQLSLLRDRLRRREAGNGELLIAAADGTILGHVYIWLEPAEEQEIRDALPGAPLIMNLWVRADCRRRGVGSTLIREAERWLVREGHHRVVLGVDPDNLEAVDLYKALHYNQWSGGLIDTFRIEYLADGRTVRHPESCVVYVKNLNGAASHACWG
ncbi:GNAT family N-acetyltransferase [Fodinicola acaciae]|uniref:GNAT family N-acetyltransferase n=1 Tax=Fodinicola acaciae TaxID=2681555 RepID=UPI0013CFB84E|nr:GNAT family N-acetyltransferase [Fodinicola acaciae]